MVAVAIRSILWAAASVFLLPAAGNRVQAAPQAQPLPTFNLSGVLNVLNANGLVLTTEAGFTWLLQAKPDTKVELTGKAKPAFLAPGQCVSVFATLDLQQGTMQGKARRLTIFSPGDKRTFGIVPDLGFGELEEATRARQRALEKPPGSTDQPNEELSKTEPNQVAHSEAKESRNKRRRPTKTGSFAINGRISGVKNGKLTVQIPPNPFVQTNLTIEVAEDADIDVELTGLPALRLAQSGDHIQASGDQVAERRGIVSHVIIRCRQPLDAAQPSKKSSRHSVKEKSASK